MKGIGASAAGAVALGSDYGMVDDAEAIVPLVVGAAVGGAAVGWALREYEVVGSNPPGEGLTASALRQKLDETTKTRKSTNASTFVDNRNIIRSGLENTLYVDGKVAAIEKINAQAAEADVLSAAQNAIKKYATTVEKNFLKSWKESVNEYASLVTTVESHPNLSWGDVASAGKKDTSRTNSVTLTDGTTFDLPRITTEDYSSGQGSYVNVWHDPTGYDAKFGKTDVGPSAVTVEGNSYMGFSDWNGVWTDLQNAISNVESGIQTWVSNAYSQV
jgi:hypothetical protein